MIFFGWPFGMSTGAISGISHRFLPMEVFLGFVVIAVYRISCSNLPEIFFVDFLWTIVTTFTESLMEIILRFWCSFWAFLKIAPEILAGTGLSGLVNLVLHWLLVGRC